MRIKNILMALPCVAILLAGCSKSSPSDLTPTDRVIRLGAGITAEAQPQSRAAVGTGTTFTAAVAGWESSSNTANYASAKSWLSQAAVTANEAAAQITLDPVRYYSQNSSIKTYMKAWYPAGTLSDDGKVTFSGTPDGTVDVLTASEVVGSAVDANGKNLAFIHPLSQLKFKIKGDATFSTVTLTSITIKEAQLPTGINLTTDVVVYGTATDVAMPGIAASQAIPTTATLVGSPVMIKPFGGKTFKVDVVTSTATYNGVTVTIDKDNAFVAGKAYTITLTFAGTNIGVSASVTPWDESGTGGGTIQ